MTLARSLLARLRRAPPPTELLVNGIRLRADDAAFAHFLDYHATGAKVWSSTQVVTEHLESDDDMQQQRLVNATVLELGSGLGLAGMACACLGASRVCLTDRRLPQVEQPAFDDLMGNELSSVTASGDEQLEALRTTLAVNRTALPGGCELTVEELAFGDFDAGQQVLERHGPFDLVLGSDISYSPQALPLLAKTLRQVASRDSLVLLGHNRRRQGLVAELFASLEEAGFAVNVRSEEDGGVMLLDARKVDL
jgi:predicted nicotinamide N-methyase